MKITKFLNIDIEPAPPEMELEVEKECREIMKANDLDNIKRYCTHLVRKKFDQDIFMASMLNRLIELEANAVVKELRERRTFSYLKCSANDYTFLEFSSNFFCVFWKFN